MLRDDAYLLDILLMAKDAVTFTKDMDHDAFLSDRKSQFAVIRQKIFRHNIREFHGPRWHV